MANQGRLDDTTIRTLPGGTVSYVKYALTTFENQANLLTYMANRPLYTLEKIPFPGFAQTFYALIV